MKILKFFREMDGARTYLLFIIFNLLVEICSLLIIQDIVMLIKFSIILLLLLFTLLYGIYVQYSSWKTIHNIGDKLVELRKLRRKKNEIK